MTLLEQRGWITWSTVITSNLTHSVILGKPRPSHNTKYRSPFSPQLVCLQLQKLKTTVSTATVLAHLHSELTSTFLFPSNIHHSYLTLFSVCSFTSYWKIPPTPAGGSLISSSFLLLLALSAAYLFPQRLLFPLFLLLNDPIHSSLHRASRISTEKGQLYTKT